MKSLIPLATGQEIDTQQSAPGSPLDLLILAWLDAKKHKSGSNRTLEAYRATLFDFRARLQSIGLDLDSQEDGQVKQIALAAQGFSRFSARPGRQVAPATINQRLAILSSFYEFAMRQGELGANPIARVERSKVEQYAGARALTQETVEQKLSAIDRTKRQGKRDYAILALLLATGRRLSEVASLELRHMEVQSGQVRVTFERCKGGKTKRDLLPLTASRALLDWLSDYYGPDIVIGNSGDRRPAWLSLSHRIHDKALDAQSIADVCQRWLGVSKVHVTRHTWAREMERAGAPVSLIQDKLGHESLATTGRYLKTLRDEENPFADKVAANLGIK